MKEAEILSKLTEYVHVLFDEHTGPVTPALCAKDVEQWDSLANVQLMVMVEKGFGIRFTSMEIDQLENLGTLAALVKEKMG